MLKAILLVVACAVLAGILPGCATRSVDDVASCNVPVVRTDGMGVKHQDCAYWTIGRIGQQPLTRR
jgi:hypothetical protein